MRHLWQRLGILSCPVLVSGSLGVLFALHFWLIFPHWFYSGTALENDFNIKNNKNIVNQKKKDNNKKVLSKTAQENMDGNNFASGFYF